MSSKKAGRVRATSLALSVLSRSRTTRVVARSSVYGGAWPPREGRGPEGSDVDAKVAAASWLQSTKSTTVTANGRPREGRGRHTQRRGRAQKSGWALR